MTDADIERIAYAVALKLRQMQTMPAGYWSLTEVAEYLGRSESGIRSMVYAGTFPPPDLGGGRGSKMGWRPETVAGFKRVS